MRDTVFFKQAEMLLRILPLIHKEEAFALKGGTAINFLVQDLPLAIDLHACVKTTSPVSQTYLRFLSRLIACGSHKIS